MEEMRTITQMTRAFGVSARLLRCCEQIRLIESRRAEGCAYRVYDEAALKRLSQLMVLRKLRISLRQMKLLFEGESASCAIRVFMENMGGAGRRDRAVGEECESRAAGEQGAAGISAGSADACGRKRTIEG